MALKQIDKRAWQIVASNRIAAASGARMFVYEADGVTEAADVVDALVDGSPVTQPLLSSADGTYDGFIDDSRDLWLVMPDADTAMRIFVRGSNRSGEFYPEDFGAAGDGTTDDTVAIQDAIDAALAWGGGKVKFRPVTYLVNTAPRTDREGRCILSTLTPGVTAFTTTPITLEGASASQWNNASGAQTVLKSTRTGDTYSATFGPASVIGSATFEQTGDQNLYSGICTIRDIRITLEENAPIAGVDCRQNGGYRWENVKVVYGDGSRTAVHPETEAFAFRGCTSQGFGSHRIDATAIGAYCALALPATDHAAMQQMICHECVVALGIETPGSGAASGELHPIAAGYISASASPYNIAGYSPSGGAASRGATDAKVYIMDLQFDAERGVGSVAAFDNVNFVLDANNTIRGKVTFHDFTGLGVGNTVANVSGAKDLKIETTRQGIIPATVASAATVTVPRGLGDHAIVKVSGSTTISTITAARAGKKLTIVWDAGATFDVTTLGNIKLAGSITAHNAEDTLTLVSDGTTWYEVARSVNA